VSRTRKKYDAICLPLGASALGGAERSLLDVAAGLASRGAVVLVMGEEPLRGTEFEEMAKERRLHLAWVPWRPERSRFLNAVSAWQTFRRYDAPLLYFNVGWRRGMWVIPVVARLAMRARMVGTMRVMPGRHWLTKRRRCLGFIPGLRLWHVPEAVVGWMWGRLLDITVSVNANDFPARLVANYGYPRSRIRVIPNGIPPRSEPLAEGTRSAMRGQLGWTNEHVVVGFVGRLSPEKGALHLLEALPGLPSSVHLMVLGEGPQRSGLEEKVAELGEQRRVKFLGFAAQPGNLIACCDVVAVPSVWQEAFGRIVIESLNEGVPVIASSVGGMSELFTDGVEGYYVPPSDTRSLGEALLKLAANPGLRREMGEAGRRLVRERYALARTVEAYCAVFDECAGRVAVSSSSPGKPS
jgi:glycosyltransferase involved in cell wall biosynthesis